MWFFFEERDRRKSLLTAGAYRHDERQPSGCLFRLQTSSLKKECRRKEQRFFIGNDARWTRGWDVDMFAYLMNFETDRLSTTLELQRVLRSFFLRTFPKRFPSWPALAPATYQSPRSSSHFLAYYPHTFGHQWAVNSGTTFRWLCILGAPLKIMVLLENWLKEFYV